MTDPTPVVLIQEKCASEANLLLLLTSPVEVKFKLTQNLHLFFLKLPSGKTEGFYLYTCFKM